MPGESPTPHIVKSIFERTTGPRPISSLFRHATPEARASTGTPAKRSGGRARSLPIGIDIGSRTLRLAQFSRANGGLELVNLGMKELPQEALGDPTRRAQLLPDALRSLVAECHIRGEAYSAVPLGIAQIKNVSLPKMPRHEVDGAVQWELRQTSTEDPGSMVFDYIILNEDRLDTSKNTDLLFITSPKEDITRHLDLLRSAGLRPLAVEVEPLSLAAWFDHQQLLKPEEVVLVLDIGADSTSLNVITGHALRFTRTLTVNGSSLTKSIADYCNVSMVEAERLKRLHGLMQEPDAAPEPAPPAPSSAAALSGSPVPSAQPAEPAQDPIGVQVRNAVALALEKLVTDIDYTFKYFSYQLTRSEVTAYHRVILTGGAAHLPRLPAFLQGRLQIPVEIIDPLAGLTIAPSLEARCRNLQEHAAGFGVALGLALRGAE